MGTVDFGSSYIFEDLVYGTCGRCNLLQILTLIPPEVLYLKNHNTEVVGKTWQTHNEKFVDFISKNSKLDHVVEIGDPTAKLAKLLADSVYKWWIIEPNPSHDVNHPEVEFIKGWVEDVELPNPAMGPFIDTVIMSHVFEHLHNPKRTLSHIRKFLKPGTSLIISIPNMLSILANKEMPPAGLHFEHTFYSNLSATWQLLKSCGFDPFDVEYFGQHSIFIAAKAVKATSNEVVVQDNISDILKSIFKKYQGIADQANYSMAVSKSRTYLYGAHFPAQLLISMGLESERIYSVLDNAPSKVGKVLYGTSLAVNAPSFIKDEISPLVLCEMGPYTEEIKAQVLKINSSTIFI